MPRLFLPFESDRFKQTFSVLRTYLVHGVLWNNIEAAQKAVGVHENDGHRPQGGDGEDADERVDPDGRAGDLQLQENWASSYLRQASLVARAAWKLRRDLHPRGQSCRWSIAPH